jgi:phosphatidylinositol glycan class F
MPLIDPVTMAALDQVSLKSQPVELLPTDLARIFTNVHAVLLLSAYYLRFPALVADPVTTLLQSLPILAVLQIAYATCCLPPTGSGTSSKPIKKPKPGAKKTDTSPSKAIVSSPHLPKRNKLNRRQTVLFALLLSIIFVPALALLQVLFGAPITTHILQTLLSSSHLSLLAVFPLVYVHGSDGERWREIVSAYIPIDEVFGAALGCFLGAWLGAVPIPLDWDREWQKWPVTIVTGAYMGYTVGKLAGAWLLRGKRIDFD